MKRAIGILAIALVAGLGFFAWAHFLPSVVGVWKGTDQNGHEHFFEFHKDGTLSWWDRDRSHDGTFKDRPRFSGSYSFKDRKTIVAKSDGFPSEPLGILTLSSDNELKQDGGDAMRDNLVYRRVADK